MPSTAKRGIGSAIPASAGIGLRADHYREVLETRPPVGWFEVHSENYFGAGGLPLDYLQQVRAEYPISLHERRTIPGFRRSLESGAPPASQESDGSVRAGAGVRAFVLALDRRPLLERSRPSPLYRRGARPRGRSRERGRGNPGPGILIENISSYMEFSASSIPEWEFLREVAQRSGCGILLDVNNIYVSARNHAFDPRRYLRSIPGELVEEIHLAGFTVNRFEGGAPHRHP